MFIYGIYPYTYVGSNEYNSRKNAVQQYSFSMYGLVALQCKNNI